jgi:hypothetical protein
MIKINIIMEAIKKLKEISLINKIMKEVENYTCLKRDREDEKRNLDILTNYIINLATKAINCDDFMTQMFKNDAEFPIEVLKSMYMTIKDVKQQVVEKLPKRSNNIDTSSDLQKFKALAIPNKNKEELDVEFGVVFDDAETPKQYSRSRSISPIRKIEKKKEIRKNEKSRSMSRS